MKNVQANAWLRFVCWLLLFFSSADVFAQLSKRPNVPIDANCNGYLEYLPLGYDTTTKRYPLLIYIEGIGSTGDGSDAALENMFTGGGYPHEQQRAGNWPDSFTVNGQTFQLLIVTPQFIAPMWNRFPSPQEVNDVINYSIAHYRIDTTRIYISGSSQGGGPVWDYVGTSSTYANRIAAIVPFAGVSFPFQEKADIIKHSPVAVWAFHNLYDDLVPASFTQDYVDMINNQGAPPLIPARGTFFNATGHLCWYLPLTRQYSENGLNVYQWMLQYHRTFSNAHAGDDQEIALPVNSVQLNGSGTGPNGTVASYSWQKLSGPAAGSLSNSGAASTTASNLELGTYIFRLTVTDNNNQTAYDDVAITVNPGAQRIEAEHYTAMSGVLNTYTHDGGGDTVLNAIDNGDWMEYLVNVPVSGDYKIRFRVGSFYSGTQFKVKDANGNVLTTVDIYNTGGWDTLMSLYRTIPLVAGDQTIRIESTGSNVWYFNWFEVIDNAAVQAPLPVHFTLFNARCLNGKTELLWQTSGEINVEKYLVEKSMNGREWQVIGNLDPMTGSSTGSSYTFEDPAVTTGSMYRIAEQDRDGRKHFSSVLRSNCTGAVLLSVYPNPVRDQALVSLTLEQAEKIYFSIIDDKGVTVRKTDKMLPGGTSQFSLSMTGLPSGTYNLLARWQGQKRTIRLVKQ